MIITFFIEKIKGKRRKKRGKIEKKKVEIGEKKGKRKKKGKKKKNPYANLESTANLGLDLEG